MWLFMRSSTSLIALFASVSEKNVWCRSLDLGLVARTIRPCRQDADAVVRRHHGVAAIDLGIVE
jgi:hypothetical protein